jgi:hypothetical protein
MAGTPIVQFCGLRAKCYSLVSQEEQKQAAAGVKKHRQKLLKHHMYVETLTDFTTRYVTQKLIQSEAHHLYTKEQRRIGLSALDVKRIILPNNIDTVPHGFY